MTESRGSEVGSVVFRSRMNPLFAVFTGLVTGVITLVTADLLLFHLFTGVDLESTSAKVLCGVFLLIGLAGLYGSVRQFVSPPSVLTATDRGLILHLDGVRYRKDGYFLPWDRVLAIDLLERKMVSSGVGMTGVRNIALKIRADDDFAPPQTISYHPDGSADTIYVDAFNSTPKGEELLRQLRQLLQCYR